MSDRNPSDPKHRAIPARRLSRLASLGGLATRVAGGMVAEGVRQLSQGNLPKPADLLLTPGNARRVADTLATMRGAAMKVGQLLSMDAGDLLPPELSQILARLRAGGHAMPMLQLAAILEQHWGKGWEAQFRQFGFTPIAAASIGQVHRAVDNNGQVLAIKVQYPGVRQSIDADVDNVATLLRVSGLLPKQLDIHSLLEEAKIQLHAEADYRLEADHARAYGQRLALQPRFRVPSIIDGLSNGDVLTMSFEAGEPVETLARMPALQRNQAAADLLCLCFRELFDWGSVQTDPNFANYLYDARSDQLVLLDFGAVRYYRPEVREAYRALFNAAVRQDAAAMGEAARAIGYFRADVPAEHQAAVLQLFTLACEPLRQHGPYDFAATDLAQRIRAAGTRLSMRQGYWHTPPVDALFLHRKLAGLYLLFARLRVQLNVQALFSEFRSPA